MYKTEINIPETIQEIPVQSFNLNNGSEFIKRGNDWYFASVGGNFIPVPNTSLIIEQYAYALFEQQMRNIPFNIKNQQNKSFNESGAHETSL